MHIPVFLWFTYSVILDINVQGHGMISMKWRDAREKATIAGSSGHPSAK